MVMTKITDTDHQDKYNNHKKYNNNERVWEKYQNMTERHKVGTWC